MRELIILRSAYLLDCPYEWQANVLMAKNTGCTQEQIDAMASEGPPTGLDDKTALVVLATDEMTKSGTLTDATLQRLRDAYDDVICRKFILIIAWFNLLARFLNGCRVPLETGEASAHLRLASPSAPGPPDEMDFFPRGGHFPAWEQPALYAEDLRQFARSNRAKPRNRIPPRAFCLSRSAPKLQPGPR
jgi:Carboxymuconolactone decarboxylase family